jgi:transglutaminase-like putative cysteine protease
MRFLVEHTTEYVYSEPATEAFSELRMRPRDSARQNVFGASTRVEPSVPVDGYTDYFGNYVETISIPFRHSQLVVTSTCNVVTTPHADAMGGLDLSIAEARQLYGGRMRELHDFLRPSDLIPFTPQLRDLAKELLPQASCFAASILGLNDYIFKSFKYTPGATDVGTTVAEFIESRKGVCQDFAHFMICICRNAGIPARYVSGYIESDPPVPGDDRDAPAARLIGAAASHAWAEIYTPNHFWVGLDPTNNIKEDERHVQIGIGRDYNDVPPLKGNFKGARRQRLNVAVKVTRNDTTLPPDSR